MLAGRAQPAAAQTAATDSLRQALGGVAPDTGRVLLLLKLAYTYRASRPDSTVRLAQRARALAQQLGYDKGEGRALSMVGASLRERGELPAAFAAQLAAQQFSRRARDPEGEASALNALGNISFDLRQYRPAIRYYRQAQAAYERLGLWHWVAGSLTNLGSCYEKLDVLDSALTYQRRAASLIARYPRPVLAAALALRNMGLVQARLGHFGPAAAYYRQALHVTYRTNDLRNRAMAQYRLATLHQTLQQPDSSLYYARQALRTAQAVAFRVVVLDANTLLAQLHQARQRPDSALYYQQMAGAAQDSLFGPEKFRQLQRLALAEQQRQLRQDEAHAAQTARTRQLGLLAALGVAVLVAALLGRSNRQQRRAHQLLNERTAEVEAQRNELSRTLTELRTTQDQLVAAEKWAFVGELSAGIAHELQNPLAFMQNFAAVSVDLLEQPNPTQSLGLKEEMMAGLRQNLREISQHGQRASSIIADMLAHARTGGQASPTDLNALVAEAVRLADPATADAAAVEVHTDFAPDLAPVAVAAPELGRALLNLLTNALYAVRHRQQDGEPGYRPVVRVSTRRVGEAVEIRVRDNGPGMSADVAAQVFQPFFSTKPAAEGTGLGLALAHDIVTKGHQGTLAVETQPGEFTEFTVRVPA